MAQWSIEKLFGSSLTEVPDPVGSVVVDADADFIPYLVVIDGTSQDPVLFLPE